MPNSPFFALIIVEIEVINLDNGVINVGNELIIAKNALINGKNEGINAENEGRNCDYVVINHKHEGICGEYEGMIHGNDGKNAVIFGDALNNWGADTNDVPGSERWVFGFTGENRCIAKSVPRPVGVSNMDAGMTRKFC